VEKKYFIITPCFNEEHVIGKFLDELTATLATSNCRFTVIIVNDFSTDNTLQVLNTYTFNSSNLELKVINLKFNVGHQSAIRQGLIYAQSLSESKNGIIVMDCDGEDDPTAILELIQYEEFDVVFVERGKRRDSLSFKLGYFIYKLLFKLITGKWISFGNYSLISPAVMKGIAHQSFFHYAGFLSKQRYDIQKIRYNRKQRLDGKSKMSFNNLVLHGLKSLIEYSDELLVFLWKSFFVIFTLTITYGGIILYKKLIAHDAILGWASSVGIGLIIVCLVIISTIILGLILISIKNILKQKEISYEVNQQ